MSCEMGEEKTVPELAVFLRPAVAGEVKTRLAAALGAEAVERLYRAFVSDTLALARAEPRLVPRLWIAGDPRHPSLADLPDGVPRARQPEGDLGQRLATALQRGLAERGAAVAIGTDAPTLPPHYLGLAVDALERASLVLGPAADGGFYLIGARDGGTRLGALLSGVRWSTRHALADTLEAARREQLAVALLPPWYDVDTVRDLGLLRLHLALRPGSAPATAEQLALEQRLAASPGSVL